MSDKGYVNPELLISPRDLYESGLPMSVLWIRDRRMHITLGIFRVRFIWIFTQSV